MIGVQLVIAGYQLPAKYNWTRWKEMALCLLPIMTLMWLFTTACIMASVSNLTLLAGLVIGSCVTCTDPILSQAIAKGPFADKYVARPLREIISSEAGANDGFGFPFLMLAVYLIRHADIPSAAAAAEAVHHNLVRSEEVGRLGGGVYEALKNWLLETWLYIVLLSVVYGAVVGYGACKAIRFALRRYVCLSQVLSRISSNLFTGSGSTTSPTFCSQPPWASSSSVPVAPLALTIFWPASSLATL